MKSACVLLMLFTAICLATAQSTAVLSGLTLKHTTLITGGGQGGTTSFATCDTPACSVQGPLLPAVDVVCEAPAGRACTFAIQAQAGVVLAYGANAFYSTTVAGQSGPHVDSNNTIFLPLAKDTISLASGASGIASFMFVIQVKNTVHNQAHNVELDLGCIGDSGAGCAVLDFGGALYTFAATVRSDVFTP